MVRHSWRGAFWRRLTGVGARRREAPHAQPAHCPAAPAITQLGAHLRKVGRSDSLCARKGITYLTQSFSLA